MTIISKPASDDYRSGHDRIFAASKVGCPRCGDTGIHSCPGNPMEPWTDDEKDRFYASIVKTTSTMPEIEDMK